MIAGASSQSPSAPGPRLAAVAMVRNECDIVELFVRINARVFDFIHVLDHRSDDGTAAILALLAARGFPLLVTQVEDVAFDQAAVTSAAVRELARRDEFDFIVPIDADEFLAADGGPSPREAIAAALAPDRFGLVPWRTFCPVTDDYFATPSPLYANFRMRAVEPMQFAKVVLGNEFAKNCTLTMGNHFARSEGFASRGVALPLAMQHVPVRSSDQLVRKIVLGSHSLALRRGRGPLEGFHWDWMAARIRERGYRLDAAALLDLALRYSSNPTRDVPRELLDDGPRVGTASDAIEFPDLARIELAKSFDNYIDTLVKALRSDVAV